jgi:long-chain acyl-CoA synthetase
VVAGALMNLASLLTKTAATWPDRPALAKGKTVVADYKTLQDRVARLASGLLSRHGLKAGDHVAIAAKNMPGFVEILFAAWHAGLVAVPINAKLHAREFTYILENAQAKLVFTSPDLETVLSEAANGVDSVKAVIVVSSADYERLIETEPAPLYDSDPDDLAWLFYTSGTTGFPKGAMLTHRNLLTMTLSYFADVDAIAETDCIIHAAPMSHGSGIYILPHIAKGACNVVPDSGGFEPDEVFELLKTWQGATFFFAPTMVMRLIAAPGMAVADTSNLKTIVYGGGPMYAEDSVRVLEALGPKLVQIYGQGEAPMTITVLTRAMHDDNGAPDYLDRLASVGIARTDTEIRIIDEQGLVAATGEIGEIILRGDVVMAGYWENPDATAAALKDGWLHTGDMGIMDEKGFITLKDRSKDIIISGGSNIYPREVEEVLLGYDGVAEVSVIGRPHADWGEEVVAFVVTKPDANVDQQALDALCLDNIARFKRPKHYRFVDALPKNNYGKVLKTALRDMV